MARIRTAEQHLASLIDQRDRLEAAGGDPAEVDNLQQLISGYLNNGIEPAEAPRTYWSDTLGRNVTIPEG